MTKPSKRELDSKLKFATNLAVNAGRILLKYQKKLSSLNVVHKDACGVASTADLKSEEYIVKNILKSFPQTSILAEESYFRRNRGGGDYNKYIGEGGVWIIDPLDGTNNFLNSFDYYSVCIAYVENGSTLLGVVYRPSSGECFSAIKGYGAKKNSIAGGVARRGKKIYQLKNDKKLKDSILITGFAAEKESNNSKSQLLSEEFLLFSKVLGSCRAVRRLGSAALDLCYVAEGIFDGFWERDLAPWDVAAAGIICQEANVKITDFNGKAFSPFNGSFLASRRPMYKKIARFLE